MFCFCDYDNVTLCHLNVRLPTQHFVVQRFHFLVDTIIPGSGVCLCEVLWRRSTTTEVHNRTDCHNGVATHNQEDTQTRLPNPQRREHNSSENKGTELFFCVLFWESCPGSSPSQQSWELLVQGFPHSHGYNNTRPIRLTGPVTPRHTKTHRKPATNGLSRHTGTLTLTPDFPR